MCIVSVTAVNADCYFPCILLFLCYQVAVYDFFCRYKGAMIEDIPRIFEAAFQCTLEVRYMLFIFLESFGC